MTVATCIVIGWERKVLLVHIDIDKEPNAAHIPCCEHIPFGKILIFPWHLATSGQKRVINNQPFVCKNKFAEEAIDVRINEGGGFNSSHYFDGGEWAEKTSLLPEWENQNIKFVSSTVHLMSTLSGETDVHAQGESLGVDSRTKPVRQHCFESLALQPTTKNALPGRCGITQI